MTIAICPACGYPTLGPDLCAFCRPLASVGARQSLPAPPTPKARTGFSPEREQSLSPHQEPASRVVYTTRETPPGQVVRLNNNPH